MPEPAVRARDLTFTYKPTGFRQARVPPALAGVSVEVRRGEVYGVLGPNGAGKTTLMKHVATLLVQDAGELSVLGHALPGSEREVRRRLGVLLGESERTFHFRLTGRQNLRFVASFLDVAPPAVKGRIDEVLRDVGLSDIADRPFHTYSTGMKHRLAAARALLPDPEVLVLDEPTAGLDVATSRALGELLLRLARQEGATVLYTTHRLEEAARLCDRIMILRDGRVVAEESPADLARLSGATTVLAVRLDRLDAGFLEGCRALPGVEAAFEDGTAGARLHVREPGEALAPLLELAARHGIRVRGITTEEPSVQDVFLELTGGRHAA